MRRQKSYTLQKLLRQIENDIEALERQNNMYACDRARAVYQAILNGTLDPDVCPLTYSSEQEGDNVTYLRAIEQGAMCITCATCGVNGVDPNIYLAPGDNEDCHYRCRISGEETRMFTP